MKKQVADIQSADAVKSSAVCAKSDEAVNSGYSFLKSFQNYERFSDDALALAKSLNNAKTEPEKSNIQAELALLDLKRAHYHDETEKGIQNTIQNVQDLHDLNDGVNKSIIFNIDSLIEYYNSFHAVSKIAFSLILLNYIIISCLISIAFIFYGNYLIHRFNLESKYPKIYKVISLRVKYQNYYLIMNVLCILIIFLIETLFCVMVVREVKLFKVSVLRR